MVTWKVLELAALTSAFGGIAWGVRYFFIPPARTTKAVWLVAPAATLTCLVQAHAIWYGGVVPARAAVSLAIELWNASYRPVTLTWKSRWRPGRQIY